MSITTEIAQDRAEAAREEAARTAATLVRRSRAILSGTTTRAGRYLQRTPDLAKDVSSRAVVLVKSNPIKTAAIGAALAAAGVGIGLFAARTRA